MSIRQKILILGVVITSINTHSYACNDELFLSHSILTTRSQSENNSKRIIPQSNNFIDSIVTRNSMELMTESPVTYVYLHTQKNIEIIGECIYYKANKPFCIIEPPCCGGNTEEYHWLQYSPLQDTIKQVCNVTVFVTTEIRDSAIIWYNSPKKKRVAYKGQLRSSPHINDTEEDEELRQIGNVIYTQEQGAAVLYELGYSKQKKYWKVCAVQYADNMFLIGWKKKQ